MERYESYFRSLLAAIKAINSSLEPATVLSAIVEQAAKAMGVKGCTLRLLNRAGTHLKAGASYGLSREYLRKGPIEVAKSGVDRQVLAGETVVLQNVSRDERFQYPEAAREEQIMSMLVVPLMVEGKAIGVLRVYAQEAREFDQTEREFLTGLADVSALAIENARLHKALKVDYEMLAAFEQRIFED